MLADKVFKANNNTHYYYEPTFVIFSTRHCQLAATCFGIRRSRKKKGERTGIH